MALLLDSHAALWMIAASNRLTPLAFEALSGGKHAVYLSVVSIWELEVKASLGKLPLPHALWDDLDAGGVITLSLERRHALAVSSLPHHHRDPFDRMLVAQALTEGMTLVTADTTLSAYGVPILW